MKRCFSYVDDVVDVIVKAGMGGPYGMVYNVGSDNFHSIQELSDTIQKIAGEAKQPNYLPSRVHEVHTAVADHTLVKTLFGYCETPLEEGLQNTWEYCQAQGPQEYEYKTLEIDGSDAIPKNWK